MVECTLIDTLRAPKIFGMAAFDWIASLTGAYIIGWFVGVRGFSMWLMWISAWTVFGVVVHYIIGVHTMFGYYLGLNPKPLKKDCSMQ